MPCEYDVDDIVPLLLVKQEQSFKNRFTVGFFGPKYFLFVVFIENGEEPREGGRQEKFHSHRTALELSILRLFNFIKQ